MAKEIKLNLTVLSEEELLQQIDTMEVEYQKLKFEHTIRGLANANDIKAKRREIARMLTESRKREVVAMTPEEIANRSKIRARRRKR